MNMVLVIQKFRRCRNLDPHCRDSWLEGFLTTKKKKQKEREREREEREGKSI